MAAKDEIKKIQFVDADTKELLTTVDHPVSVNFLLKKSELIQHLLEMGRNSNTPARTLIIPVGKFLNDRRQTFVNILNGVPVGYEEFGGVYYYPLGPEEEKEIRTLVDKKFEGYSENDKLLEKMKERVKVIYDTMRYLILSDDDIDSMLVFETEFGPTEDDEIEERVELYKKWLYLIGSKEKLSRENRTRLKKYFNTATRNWKKKTDRGNYNDYEPHPMDPLVYEPEETTNILWPLEYERWLREVYFKEERKPLKEEGGGTARRRRQTKRKAVKKRTTRRHKN